MLRKFSLSVCSSVCFFLLLCVSQVSLAQYGGFSLDEAPWTFTTSSPQSSIEVSVVARGIEQPFGMVFLPVEGVGEGKVETILVSTNAGDIRIIRNGELLGETIAGLPDVADPGGLQDLLLHPDFTENRWLYFTYVREGEAPAGQAYWTNTVVARGKLSDDLLTLTDVTDVFVPEAWGDQPGGHGSRLRFAPDGTLFMSSPFRRDFENPQNTLSHISKLLRINDDGSVPADNPFVGNDDYLPEIYTLGHRTIEGMVFHPETGELWVSEHGPMGGDEVNIIYPGANYGWPDVTYGRDYDGSRQGVKTRDDVVDPELIWVPSIAPSGTMFYTGDVFSQWQGNLFVGSLMTGRMQGTGHIERIAFNENGEQRREWLLGDLHQRIRDVQQGPDGLIYVLTAEDDGALLRIAPSADE